jgi:2-methylcitrate dehydratase PrpD
VFGHELTRRIHAIHPEMARDPLDQGHSMGCAVAAGILLGLTLDEMDRALSFAATMVAGTMPPITQETEHMVKSFMRARLDIEEPGPEFMAGLGEDFSIRTMNFKWASAGGPNQAPRLALLEIMSENGLTAEDIESILIEVRPGGYTTVTTVPHPTIYAPTVQALAAVYGGIGFRETHLEAYHRSPEVLDMEKRITIRPNPAWPARRHYGAATVTTKDGRTLYKESTWKPMPEEDLDLKFLDLVGLRVGEPKAKELAQVLKRLDRSSNIADIMAQLEFPEANLE